MKFLSLLNQAKRLHSYATVLDAGLTMLMNPLAAGTANARTMCHLRGSALDVDYILAL